ncbi:hypothetical protein Nepgr_023180 [Nepenthes gracilis]|uniref:Uncharacterized protein n=1 Tax=Nepenthes gracilis TaxID=150966 RepID=A0AAD3T1K4_NEPGR|nr:hypothetical protein Nepgr_023180 [Nepenthes gracilis]
MKDMDQFEEEARRRNSSMVFRNGSIESSGSSQSEYERVLRYKTDLETIYFYFPGPISSIDGEDMCPACWRDCFLPNWMGEDEEIIYMSPNSQTGGRNGVNDQMNTPDAGSGISFELGEGGDQTKEAIFGIAESRDLDPSNEGGSSTSTRTSSFAFPALQWEWVGSPVAWPKLGRLHFIKHKSWRVSSPV